MSVSNNNILSPQSSTDNSSSSDSSGRSSPFFPRSPSSVLRVQTPPPPSETMKKSFICRCLNRLGVKNRSDLIRNIGLIASFMITSPNLFAAEAVGENFQTIQESVKDYNRLSEGAIYLKNSDLEIFATKVKEARRVPIDFEEHEEMSRVIQNYDLFEKSKEKLSQTSQAISDQIQSQASIYVPVIILGAGDNGTTVWLEKYKEFHRQTAFDLSDGQLPDALMIAEDYGSWKHDYTLAQPVGTLERAETVSNPGDFLTEEQYSTNPYLNARHLYQSNLINLADTDAPILLGARAIKIEKRENHLADWEGNAKYRLLLKAPSGQEVKVYTDEIDVCTGLGPARNPFTDQMIPKQELERLSQFSKEKGFTPIVDGNTFMLTPQEEKGPARSILVYGSGGTATAVIRKSFFNTDIHTEGRPYTQAEQQHSIICYARDPVKDAGFGKIVRHAISEARKINALVEDVTIKKIEEIPATGQLKVTFESHGNHQEFVTVCDQIVSCTGQSGLSLMELIEEILPSCELHQDQMPVCIRDQDASVHFYGPAAGLIEPNQHKFLKETKEWTDRENVGYDAVPGTLAITRAQIKKHLIGQGKALTNVQVNIDSIDLIQEFLKLAGASAGQIAAFSQDILQRRKDGFSGFSHDTLGQLLETHKLNSLVEIRGHSHLVFPSSSL